MKHPFDGIIRTEESEPAATQPSASSRRSFLGWLGAGVVMLVGQVAHGQTGRPSRRRTRRWGEDGGTFTTRALGEEGGGPVSTRALGEEGGGGPVSTRALGEEGAGGCTVLNHEGGTGGPWPPVFTRAWGEGGVRPVRPVTTYALGEEGGGRGPVPTTAFGEGGGRGRRTRRQAAAGYKPAVDRAGTVRQRQKLLQGLRRRLRR